MLLPARQEGAALHSFQSDGVVYTWPVRGVITLEKESYATLPRSHCICQMKYNHGISLYFKQYAFYVLLILTLY